MIPLSAMTDEQRAEFFRQWSDLVSRPAPEIGDAELLAEGYENERQAAIDRGESVSKKG